MRIGCAGWNFRSSIWRCFPPPAVTCIATRGGSMRSRSIRASIGRTAARPMNAGQRRHRTTSRLRSSCRNRSRTSSASPQRRRRSIFFSIKRAGLAQNSVRSWSSCRQAWHSIPLWRARSLPRFGRAMRATWSASPGMRLGSPPQPTHCWRSFQIARAAADPPVGPAPFAPGGWQGLHYYRLHGAPHIYYSEYDAAFLQRLAQTLSERSGACWCIFDNTARGAAITNAVSLQRLFARLQT